MNFTLLVTFNFVDGYFCTINSFELCFWDEVKVFGDNLILLRLVLNSGF